MCPGHASAAAAAQHNTRSCATGHHPALRRLHHMVCASKVQQHTRLSAAGHQTRLHLHGCCRLELLPAGAATARQRDQRPDTLHTLPLSESGPRLSRSSRGGARSASPRSRSSAGGGRSGSARSRARRPSAGARGAAPPPPPASSVRRQAMAVRARAGRSASAAPDSFACGRAPRSGRRSTCTLTGDSCSGPAAAAPRRTASAGARPRARRGPAPLVRSAAGRTRAT